MLRVEGLSCTREAMLELLMDGRRHRREEFIAMIDELSLPGAIHNHITTIRKYLAKHGQDIINTWQFGPDGRRIGYYQLVRIIASPNSGRR